MAADDNDLTFIRCPGCRSLVPAVATRCRMCGQLLDGKKAASDDAPQKSRVRQRTLSVNEEERESVKESYAPVEEDDGDEPLFPESEAPEEQAEPVLLPEAVRAFAQADDDQRGPRQKATVLFDARELEEEDDEGDEEEPAEASASDSSDPVKRKRRRRRRKKRDGVEPVVSLSAEVRAESKTDALGWRRSDANPAPLSASIPVSTPVSAPAPVVSHQRPSAPREDIQAMEPRRSTHEQPVPVIRTEPIQRREPVEESRKDVREDGRAPLGEQYRPPTRGPSESSDVRPVDGGALVGWMVTYGLDGGAVSRELRSGRFFLSREKLRPTDIVFPHHSISMPHAMLTASIQEGVTLQDLMSEHGTQVKRAGRSAFEALPEGGQITIGHGDMVRLGQYDVLICLLPGVRN